MATSQSSQNIGGLLFVPTGRISPADFIKGACVLVAVNALIGLSPLVSATLSSFLGILGLVILYCWVALWIKRYHEGGKSGWNCLIPILVYLIVGTVGAFFAFGGDFIEAFKEMFNMLEEGASQTEAEAAMTERLEAMMTGPGFVIKNTIIGAALSLLIAFLFNKIIPVDPGPNRFDEGGTSEDIFE